MANTTTTQIDAAVNYFYDRKMLMKAKPALNYLRFAQFRDIPANTAESIKFRRYTLLSAATTALSEGVTPAGSQLSKTDVYCTPLQYGDYVTITDKLIFTTQDPVLQETADVLGQQAGNTLDQLTRAVLAATTTIQYASTAAAITDITSAMKITKAEIQEAVKTLKVANAKKITAMIDPTDKFNTTPIPACYVAWVHPNTTYDLKNLVGFIPVEQYSGKAAMPDEVGSLDEVRFIESTNAKVFSSGGSGSIDVYGTIIVGQEAYAASRISGEAMRNIIKPLGSAGSADPLDQRQTSGWKATFVAKILNNDYMLMIEHAVS
jgi:N4-gp56 family major capsid protein